jgi:hypothetical protein
MKISDFRFQIGDIRSELPKKILIKSGRCTPAIMNEATEVRLKGQIHALAPLNPCLPAGWCDFLHSCIQALLL